MTKKHHCWTQAGEGMTDGVLSQKKCPEETDCNSVNI